LFGPGEPLHCGEGVIDIRRWREATDRRCDNAVGRDDKGCAFRKSVTDFHAACVLETSFFGIDF
jgi:hypothetical protein